MEIDFDQLEKLLILMQKYGVQHFDNEYLKLDIIPVAPPAPPAHPTMPLDAQYKEPEMPLSMAMWGAKYNG